MNDLALLQNQYLKQINTFGILRTAVLPTVNPTNLGGIHFKTERPLQRRSKPTQKVLKSVLGVNLVGACRLYRTIGRGSMENDGIF